MNKARNLHAYKQLRAKQRAYNLPCWLCGGTIDYNAVPKSRYSFSLDHIHPVSLGGDVLDPANARSAHFGCNAARGNRPPRQRLAPVATSRQWLTKTPLPR